MFDIAWGTEELRQSPLFWYTWIITLAWAKNMVDYPLIICLDMQNTCRNWYLMCVGKGVRSLWGVNHKSFSLITICLVSLILFSLYLPCSFQGFLFPMILLFRSRVFSHCSSLRVFELSSVTKGCLLCKHVFFLHSLVQHFSCVVLLSQIFLRITIIFWVFYGSFSVFYWPCAMSSMAP